jgi:hypothetical protein
LLGGTVELPVTMAVESPELLVESPVLETVERIFQEAVESPELLVELLLEESPVLEEVELPVKMAVETPALLVESPVLEAVKSITINEILQALAVALLSKYCRRGVICHTAAGHRSVTTLRDVANNAISRHAYLRLEIGQR